MNVQFDKVDPFHAFFVNLNLQTISIIFWHTQTMQNFSRSQLMTYHHPLVKGRKVKQE